MLLLMIGFQSTPALIAERKHRAHGDKLGDVFSDSLGHLVGTGTPKIPGEESRQLGISEQKILCVEGT